MLTPAATIDLRNWSGFRNSSGEAVPAFAVMEITAKETVDGETLLVIGKPSSNSMSPERLLFNGPISVPNGRTGVGYSSVPAEVLCADGPDVGDDLGTEASSWELHEGYAGFVCLGDADDLTGVVVVRRQGPPVAFVRITSLSKVDGRYPAKLQVYDAESKTWADGEDVWYVDANES